MPAGRAALPGTLVVFPALLRWSIAADTQTYPVTSSASLPRSLVIAVAARSPQTVNRELRGQDAGIGNWFESDRRHKPHQSQAFILDIFRGAAIGRVHDRYITSPRQVHDRLNQIQSLRGIPGNPCGMTPPLAQRPDPRAASLTTALCQSSTRRRATRTRSPPPWQPRWDGAGRCGSLPRAAGTNKPSAPSIASRTAENRPPGMRGMHQSGEQSGWPRNGTKRARIGKASGSTNRSFGPDAVRYMSVTIATP